MRVYRERPSDSPFVHKVGYFRLEGAYSQVCAADVAWSMLLVTVQDKTVLTVWGPMTRSGLMEYPDGAEFTFIHFKLGRFIPKMPFELLKNGIVLPGATTGSCWFNGSAREFPTYENADTFVNRLVRDGFLDYDALVDEMIYDHPLDIPERTLRHRFQRSTGMSRTTVRQIERAKAAAAMLERGEGIADTAYEAGYTDQAHMTRAFKRWIGQSPGEVAKAAKTLKAVKTAGVSRPFKV